MERGSRGFGRLKKADGSSARLPRCRIYHATNAANPLLTSLPGYRQRKHAHLITLAM